MHSLYLAHLSVSKALQSHRQLEKALQFLCVTMDCELVIRKEWNSVQQKQKMVIKEYCDDPVYSTVGIRRE